MSWFKKEEKGLLPDLPANELPMLPDLPGKLQDIIPPIQRNDVLPILPHSKDSKIKNMFEDNQVQKSRFSIPYSDRVDIPELPTIPAVSKEKTLELQNEIQQSQLLLRGQLD